MPWVAYEVAPGKKVSGLFRILLGGLFLCVGVIKGFRSATFAGMLAYTYSVPNWASALIAALIPVVEIALGLGILFVVLVPFTLRTARVLTLAYALLYCWGLVVLRVEEPFNCFAPFVSVPVATNVALFLAVTFVTWLPARWICLGTGLADVQREKSHGYRRLVAPISVVLVIVAVSVLKYEAIAPVLKGGLVSNTNIAPARERLQAIFGEITSRYVIGESYPCVLLVLRSLDCGHCREEVIYWDAVSQTDNVSVLALFPGDVVQPTKMIDNTYLIRFPLLVLPKKQWVEIAGEQPGLVSRILFSNNKQFIFANQGDNDKQRGQFVKTLFDHGSE